MDAVTQDGFDAEVVEHPGKVLVDFWAEWCQPCRAIEPVLSAMADDHPAVKFLKCDVDENPAVAQRYDVMNIPTLLAFEGGNLVKRIVGALNKQKLADELAGWLG